MVKGCLFAHGSHANAPHLLLAMSLLHAAAFLASCGSSPAAAAAGFSRDFANLWGPQHQTVSGDGSTVTIWLDRHSGSGFRSRRAFRTGYFAASIRLQPGYTAGVITAFYLSNNQAHPGFHDEVDIEFLGTTPGRPYTLQTNVYVRGSGDGRVIGREMKFHLWFDPTAASHSYAILWGPSEIAFFVDGVPIRRYPRLASMATATFPARPMWVYGTIWDASSWATDNGRYRADYRYQPFVARFSGFVVRACAANAPPRCRHGSAGAQLSRQQVAAMERVQQRYMVYNYCRDPKRDHSLTPECAHRPA